MIQLRQQELQTQTVKMWQGPQPVHLQNAINLWIKRSHKHPEHKNTHRMKRQGRLQEQEHRKQTVQGLQQGHLGTQTMPAQVQGHQTQMVTMWRELQLERLWMHIPNQHYNGCILQGY